MSMLCLNNLTGSRVTHFYHVCSRSIAVLTVFSWTIRGSTSARTVYFVPGLTFFFSRVARLCTLSSRPFCLPVLAYILDDRTPITSDCWCKYSFMIIFPSIANLSWSMNYVLACATSMIRAFYVMEDQYIHDDRNKSNASCCRVNLCSGCDFSSHASGMLDNHCLTVVTSARDHRSCIMIASQ